MPELEIVRPAKPYRISFTPAPVYNNLASLFILMESTNELFCWVSRTTHPLDSERMDVNCHVSRAAFSYLHGDTTSAFLDWVDAFDRRDPHELVQHEARELIAFAGVYLPDKPSFPSPTAVLKDRDTYLELTRSIVEAQHGSFKPEFYSAEFERLQHPEERKHTIVNHLRWAWNNLIEEEWKQTAPMLLASVNAHRSISYQGLSRKDAIQKVTGINRIPAHWDIWLPEVEELVFIPSVHIGNFLLLAEVHAGKAYILFPAGIPQDAAYTSPALSRTELLTRLRALADETRLLILELTAHQGPQSAQNVMDGLELSQSSASRHLSQLSTAGFLHIEKKDGVKVYSPAVDRIEDTFTRLKEYLKN